MRVLVGCGSDPSLAAALQDALPGIPITRGQIPNGREGHQPTTSRYACAGAESTEPISVDRGSTWEPSLVSNGVIIMNGKQDRGALAEFAIANFERAENCLRRAHAVALNLGRGDEFASILKEVVAMKEEVRSRSQC
jgi:hypothetical protein